jgi:hypothetical protein
MRREAHPGRPPGDSLRGMTSIKDLAWCARYPHPVHQETTYARLLTLMRVRYDYYSAETILLRALGELGLNPGLDYGFGEVQALADRIAESRAAERVGALVGQIRLLAEIEDSQRPAEQPLHTGTGG